MSVTLSRFLLIKSDQIRKNRGEIEMSCRIYEKGISILGTGNRGSTFVAYVKDKGF